MHNFQYRNIIDSRLVRKFSRRFRFRGGHGHSHEIHSGQKIVLAGNPNVGKSVIFNALTGKYADVSNYPGTSVEISQGNTISGGKSFKIIDSPGVVSLVPRSEDERVTLDILTSPDIAGVVQVIDTKNLKRGLLLTIQLAEMGFPMVVCLNMYDEAEERGFSIDTAALEKTFGVKFIRTTAVSGRGLDELSDALQNMQIPHFHMRFHSRIEETAEAVSKVVTHPVLLSRGLALNIISSGGNIPNGVLVSSENSPKIKKEIAVLTKNLPSSPGYEVQNSIAGYIDTRLPGFIKRQGKDKQGFKERLGWAAMHPRWGIIFVLLALYIMYELVGVFGAGTCVDFIETNIFGGIDDSGNYFGIINPAFIRGFAPLKASPAGAFIVDMLVGPYGVITVGLTYSIAIVFPIVSLFFIFFGILEDSGYLPRLTVLSNRLFKLIGMNGRAVLPMVLGLGCDTMATFTTRILETRKERNIATLLLALGIPCSAQLGVILGMMSSVSIGMLFVVIGTVLLQLALVGYAASKIIPGKPSPLIAEVPPMRIPLLKNILLKTYFRVKLFMKEAVPLFILGTMVLFLLDKLNFLQVLENMTSPVITGFLQLPQEATEAFIVGFLRRDYGAAGLFFLAEKGLMDSIQITVGITVMVLFVPCLANFFVMIKERGWKTAGIMSVFIIFYAVLVGGVLNQILRLFN